jgi:hypothetical protein
MKNLTKIIKNKKIKKWKKKIIIKLKYKPNSNKKFNRKSLRKKHMLKKKDMLKNKGSQKILNQLYL